MQVSQKLGRSLRSSAPQSEVVHEGWSDFLGEPGGVGGGGEGGRNKSVTSDTLLLLATRS